MKKFSEIRRPIRKINEQDETPVRQDDPNPSDTAALVASKANLPENIEQSEESEKSEEGTAGLAGFDAKPSKLFSKLFECREMAHIYHLQVKGDAGSYAAHMALGAFYEGVLDLVDDLIETYQGQYDVVEGYDIIDTKDTRSKDKLEYFMELANSIKSERKCISAEDTHLHNIIDEIVALTYKTIYKLKFNK